MEWLSNIYNVFNTFTQWVMNVLSYIRSILQGLWYWLQTLLTWIYDLVWDVFNSWIFSYVKSVYDYIVLYIWDWGVSLLSTILFISIIIPFISFVFRLFRMNLDKK